MENLGERFGRWKNIEVHGDKVRSGKIREIKLCDLIEILLSLIGKIQIKIGITF